MLALNVPAGSVWYLAIMGNSLVVTIVKLAITTLAFPQVSQKLARFKLGVRGDSAGVTSCGLAIRLHKSQANSFFVFGVGIVLVAPMFAVLTFDESCLRSQHMLVVSCELHDSCALADICLICQVLSRLCRQFKVCHDHMGDR